MDTWAWQLRDEAAEEEVWDDEDDDEVLYNGEDFVTYFHGGAA